MPPLRKSATSGARRIPTGSAHPADRGKPRRNRRPHWPELLRPERPFPGCLPTRRGPFPPGCERRTDTPLSPTWEPKPPPGGSSRMSALPPSPYRTHGSSHHRRYRRSGGEMVPWGKVRELHRRSLESSGGSSGAGDLPPSRWNAIPSLGRSDAEALCGTRPEGKKSGNRTSPVAPDSGGGRTSWDSRRNRDAELTMEPDCVPGMPEVFAYAADRARPHDFNPCAAAISRNTIRSCKLHLECHRRRKLQRRGP